MNDLLRNQISCAIKKKNFKDICISLVDAKDF